MVATPEASLGLLPEGFGGLSLPRHPRRVWLVTAALAARIAQVTLIVALSLMWLYWVVGTVLGWV